MCLENPTKDITAGAGTLGTFSQREFYIKKNEKKKSHDRFLGGLSSHQNRTKPEAEGLLRTAQIGLNGHEVCG